MDIMGIAGVATEMKMAQFQNEVSMRVMKMAIDNAEQVGDELVDIMASMTGAGQVLDTTV